MKIKPLPILAALLLIVACGPAAAQQPARFPVIGRWDLNVKGPTGPSFPSWLEIQLSGDRTLVGRFVARVGSARPISKIEYADRTIRFSFPPQWEQGDADFHVEGKLEGDALSGWMTDATGKRMTWTATRAPLLLRSTEPAWGDPIALFNGTDLTGWTSATNAADQWKVVDGILTSPKSGANLFSHATFTDFRLHAEFRYPKGGNSGIYLRGRYEVQIEDSKGEHPESIHLGGIYGFLPPNEDAALSAGEWQTVDITLAGRIVTVVLNGKTVISRQEIPGITGGAMDGDEGSPGPIFLQGDHTPIEFRRILLTPAKN